jgi:hypothetical protein
MLRQWYKTLYYFILVSPIFLSHLLLVVVVLNPPPHREREKSLCGKCYSQSCVLYIYIYIYIYIFEEFERESDSTRERDLLCSYSVIQGLH